MYQFCFFEEISILSNSVHHGYDFADDDCIAIY